MRSRETADDFVGVEAFTAIGRIGAGELTRDWTETLTLAELERHREDLRAVVEYPLAEL